ncbi:hypothetical protein O9H85_14320 [Paenibacillus filicis]|uniref:Exosporium protein C n=1 Tax=Paenibacillus gyeongsangnamensis TaxID=3388067 RepID=A0ABT4Q9M9_9BACL|nr:hypothetical protein [Paenibacillus filicis]MCZ8513588.1 hypothetical protein [Paenibacillus filicis]
MPFTTGYITNTKDVGTAASNVVVNMVNENTTNAATVEVRIFYSLVPDVKIPLYVTTFTLPVNSIKRNTYFIQGVLAYEVQFNVTSVTPTDVVVSTFGLDQFGNLVIEQGIIQSDMTAISALSPTS